MQPVQLAAVLATAVVLASVLSVELGISVALLELGLGIVAGNAFGLDPGTDWLVFIASFASIVLTFLAGAEVDPEDFRERFGATVSIGVVSFVGPFVVAWLVAWGLLGWEWKAALIAGTALSTTSLAVVYAVLVETGLNRTQVGKRSDKALDCALSICAALGARLTPLAVEGRLPAYAATAGEVDEVKREKDKFFRRVLRAARDTAEARGVEVRTELVPGRAAEVITHYARAHAHDLIVIGHRGHFLGDYLLGSTADRVAHHAYCPVMVVR